MEPTRTFVLFSAEHQITMLVCALIGAILVWGPKYFMQPDAIDKTARNAGIFFLIYELIGRLEAIFIGGAMVVEVLPLHLCSISAILCGVMLINRSKAIFDVVYYTGLIGGGMSLLTPNITMVFPMFNYFRYFFGHGYILVAIFFMIVVYEYRPSKYSLLKAVVFCNVVMLITGVVNAGWGTNFLYTCEKPHGATLMDFLGVWPYYLVGLELLGVFFFALLYAPVFCYDLIKARSKRAYDNS